MDYGITTGLYPPCIVSSFSAVHHNIKTNSRFENHGSKQHVRSTIITTSADFPLIHNAKNPVPSANGEGISATPLEKNHAAFVVGLAHRATMVLQLRTLDTGAAKDVSGVLRMSRGGGFDDRADNTDDTEGGHVVEKEVLYFVRRDGGVRVFGRGEV